MIQHASTVRVSRQIRNTDPPLGRCRLKDPSPLQRVSSDLLPGTGPQAMIDVAPAEPFRLETIESDARDKHVNVARASSVLFRACAMRHD